VITGVPGGLSYSDRVSTPEKPIPDLAALQDLGPFANTIGLTVTAASADELTASWTVSEGLLQPYGLLHGGVHCSVVETLASMAAAVWLGPSGQVVGTTNTTDFFRASRTGDRLSSTARPLHRGRSRQVWRVETVDDQGRLVAAGQVGIQNLTS
jgi:1,4-dihydroxy-2-naphthoyl-CoA hydrolase